MTAISPAAFGEFRRQTFASLLNPNYRTYFSGQAVSVIGTWMQTIAQSWLVLQITGSATDLGLLVALQTLPILLLGSYGGVIADRMDKRKLMMGLQAMMGLLALILGILTLTHTVALWQIFLLAFLLGLNNCFENPARQSFVKELVGPGDLRNAVSLNSVLVSAARMIGPAFAGLIIAAGGAGVCFLLNAVSFGAVISSLARLDTSKLHTPTPNRRGKGQLREGLRYVRSTPALLIPLLMIGLVGCLAFEFQVSLPIIAKNTFHGGPQTYGYLTGAMGIGAVIGGLWVAARGRTGIKAMRNASFWFGIVMIAAAFAPNLWTELIAIALVGAGSVSFMSKANTTLQVRAAPMMQGRVMALWAVAFLGSTPIGGPIVGGIGQHLGPRYALALGAISCLVATAMGAFALHRLEQGRNALPSQVAPEAVETISPDAGGLKCAR